MRCFVFVFQGRPDPFDILVLVHTVDSCAQAERIRQGARAEQLEAPACREMLIGAGGGGFGGHYFHGIRAGQPFWRVFPIKLCSQFNSPGQVWANNRQFCKPLNACAGSAFNKTIVFCLHRTVQQELDICAVQQELSPATAQTASRVLEFLIPGQLHQHIERGSVRQVFGLLQSESLALSNGSFLSAHF